MLCSFRISHKDVGLSPLALIPNASFLSAPGCLGTATTESDAATRRWWKEGGREGGRGRVDASDGYARTVIASGAKRRGKSVWTCAFKKSNAN